MDKVIPSIINQNINSVSIDKSANIKIQPQQELIVPMVFSKPERESSETEKIFPSVIQQNINSVSADDNNLETDIKAQPQQKLVEPMIFFDPDEKANSELAMSFLETSEKPIEDKSNSENSHILKPPVSQMHADIVNYNTKSSAMEYNCNVSDKSDCNVTIDVRLKG